MVVVKKSTTTVYHADAMANILQHCIKAIKEQCIVVLYSIANLNG